MAWVWAAGAALGLALLAPPAWAGGLETATAVVLEPAPLSTPEGQELPPAAPGQALELLERRGPRLLVGLPQGQRAWLSATAAAVFPGPPGQQAPRLARLAAAPFSQPLRRRLLAGRIAAGDSQWQVELAWGRPWRSYMVNLFRDEEHYISRDQAGNPLMLRFKEGRLEPPLPRESLAVESSPSPR